MSRPKRTDKFELLILLVLVFAVQLSITTTYVLNMGTDKLAAQLFRVLVVGVLCGLTFVKLQAAKWLLIVWMVLNAVIATTKPGFFSNYWLVGLTLFYTSTPIYLLFSPNISRYLKDGTTDQKAN